MLLTATKCLLSKVRWVQLGTRLTAGCCRLCHAQGWAPAVVTRVQAGMAVLGRRGGDGPQSVCNLCSAWFTSSRGNRRGSYGADCRGGMPWRKHPPAALGHVQECWLSSWMSFGGESPPVTCRQEVWAVHSRVHPRCHRAG